MKADKSGLVSAVESAQGVGDEGLAVEIVGGVEGFVAGFFVGGDGGVELAGGDLFGGGVDEAELAGGEVVLFGAHGWAEGAAEDGAVFVEVAGAVVEVEDGAGLVVGELFEEDGRLRSLREDAGGEVAGEPGVEAGEGLRYAFVDACGFGWVLLFEGCRGLRGGGRRPRGRWGRRRCSIASSRVGRRGVGRRVGMRRRLRCLRSG